MQSHAIQKQVTPTCLCIVSIIFYDSHVLSQYVGSGRCQKLKQSSKCGRWTRTKNLGVLVIRKHWISRLDRRINPYEWVLWPWSLWRRRWSVERCHSTNDYFVCYASFYQTYRSAKKSMNSLQALWNFSRKSWWPLSGGAPVFSK